MIDVSVVMPVHNGGPFLRHALGSILQQTLSNFEVIVVDDGSTDDTPSILDGYDDRRIVRIRNEEKLGLTRSLNRGLASARGEFVARMDADDISLPTRFLQQVEFLRRRPDVGILGSSYEIIDEEGRNCGYHRMPATDPEIRWTRLLANPFAHPTVMMRRSVLARHSLAYDETFETAQDYDLWCRTLRHTKGANLEESLVRYRLSEGLSRRHRDGQLANHDVVSMRAIGEELPDFKIRAEEVGQLRQLFGMCDESAPGVAGRRVALSHLYLGLFEAFWDRHGVGGAGRETRRQAALKVAGVVFHRPFERGSPGILKRLTILSPVVIPLHIFGWAKRRRERGTAQSGSIA